VNPVVKNIDNIYALCKPHKVDELFISGSILTGKAGLTDPPLAGQINLDIQG
jgi:hypothetical protein